MPLYSFYCSVCNKTTQIVKSMRDDTIPECCDRKMIRDLRIDLPMVGNREYTKPLHSDALAVSPAQVEEHKKLFPDVPLDSERRPVFTSFSQHDKYLKTCGFEKLPQRKRRSTTKIT
jgi:hypothetical protein